jgi:mRNA-degrading endonuclease toxin of MazEF toxin-antitoxin module
VPGRPESKSFFKASQAKSLDQIRTVDKIRLVKRLGKLDSETANADLDTLGELFAL